jgi:predicted GNAT family acetyltransferase
VGHDSILIKHTEVATEHEGKGYGSQLVRRALDDMRSRHKTVIPICPYALAWIRRHREYADLVREDMRSRL